MTLRIVVNTNVLVSGAVAREGYPGRVLTAWRSNRAVLLMLLWQRAELADVVTRPKLVSSLRLTDQTRDDLLVAIDDASEMIAPGASPVPVRDAEDEAILALAVTGRATHLITGDRDLLVLDGDPQLGTLRILTPRSFCEEVLDA